MKICSKCKTEYPPTREFFYVAGHHSDGLTSWCKKCQKERSQLEINKGAHRKANQKYRQTINGKYIRQKYSKEYYKTIKGHLQQVFYNINQRCNNPKHPDYKSYGGRGIINKFKSSDEFIEYIINKLQLDPRGLDVDRIDNNGNYEPDNIRFVTHQRNCKNRRILLCQDLK